MKHLSLLPAAAAALTLLASACTPAVPEARSDAARFDRFDYAGRDAIYEAHPLADEASYHNPILPGWYSDPSVCTNGEGDYFLATSTFVYFPGVPLFHSRDLVNWRQIGHILDRESQLVNLPGQHVSGGIFAPAIAYNPHNRTYYMITTNVGAGNFFVKTQDPFGSWSDPIPLPAVRGIDPSFFFDDDGRAYIVNNDDAPGDRPEYPGHRTIRIRAFDVEHDCTVGEETILVNKGVHPEEKPIWIEGPHLYKIDGRYYLMSAEGGTSDWHSEVIFRGDSPTGPFTPWSGNPILTQRHLDPQRPDPVTCAGHADLIQAAEGDWWAFFLACRPVEGGFENLGRETFLMPVRWSDDGFPYITTGDELVPVTGRREGVQRAGQVTFGNFAWSDDFAGERLGPEWVTLRGAAAEQWSLTEEPGWLCLTCSPESAAQKGVPAFVGRRLQHHAFTASTRLIFDAADPANRAGLLLFKNETHHYFLAVGCCDGAKRIALWRVDAEGEHCLAEAPLADEATDFVLEISSEDGRTFAFRYAVADGELTLLCDGVDARFLSTAEAGGFTGTVVGPYALRTE